MNIEIIGYLAGVCTTISFLPQAIKIIKTKDTKAISLPTYILLSVGTILWLAYGILLSSFPMILTNSIALTPIIIILILKIKYE